MQTINHIYDISKELFTTECYPGDPSANFSEWFSIDKGNPCNLHVINIGTHTGTHIDAPSHFIREGIGVDKIDLSKTFGKCIVIERDGLLDHEVLNDKCSRDDERILVKGAGVLTEEGAQYLVEKKIKLYGTELNTVGDKEIHRILLSNNIVILENLSLEGIFPGRYNVCALPLKMGRMDGSPVRAILWD